MQATNKEILGLPNNFLLLAKLYGLICLCLKMAPQKEQGALGHARKLCPRRTVNYSVSTENPQSSCKGECIMRKILDTMCDYKIFPCIGINKNIFLTK